MLQIILLHILGQVINLHLKTKTSEHSKWPVLWANTGVGVVQFYNITMGTQTVTAACGAGTRLQAQSYCWTDSESQTDRHCCSLCSKTLQHVSASLESYQVQIMFLLHFYDVLSSIRRHTFHIHAALQEQRPDGRKGSPNMLCGYWCVSTSSPLSASSTNTKAPPIPQTKVLSFLVVGWNCCWPCS